MRACVRALLVLEDLTEETWPEFEECKDGGACPHEARGRSCEYRRRFGDEVAGAFAAETVADARAALSVARRHKPGRRPRHLSWALEVLANVAAIEDGRHRRAREKARAAAAGGR